MEEDEEPSYAKEKMKPRRKKRKPVMTPKRKMRPRRKMRKPSMKPKRKMIPH